MVPSRVGRRLLDRLGRRREEMVDLLRHLARAESPSGVPASQAAVQAILAEELRRAGLDPRIHPGRATGGHLLAASREWKPTRPYQLLIGHSDTVWPLGTLRTMRVRRRGDRLYGPGVYDMKGGLVEIVHAVRAARETAGTAPVAPVVLINSDEEIGSPESAAHIRRLARRADRVLVMEPSLGATGKLKTRRRGGGELVLRVTGRAAHAGIEPEKGASAILELARTIERLHALSDPARGISVNVGLVSGGTRPNVIAPTATAVVDVRARTLVDARRVEAAIRALRASTPGTWIAVEGRLTRPPLERTPRNRLLWRRALDAAADVDIVLEEGESGGSSDGNLTSLLAPTLDGLGPVGDGAHAPHEHVRIESLVERGALLARLLLEPPIGGPGPRG